MAENGKKPHKGNFEFVRQYYPDHPDYFALLSRAENICQIDCEQTGRILRNFLDQFCTDLVEEYNLNPESSNLDGKIKALQQYRGEGNPLLREIEGLFCKDYKMVNGETCNHSVEWCDFVRQFGNACSHPTDIENYGKCPAVNTDNALKALELLYSVIREKTLRQNPNIKIPEKFNEDIMPIAGRYIIDAYNPADRRLTSCVKEYLTCSFNESDALDHYSIVRKYSKPSTNSNYFMLRERDASSLAMRTADTHFNGKVEPEDISSLSNERSKYYIIGYKFYGEPERLTDELLKSMSLPEREKLCYDIALIVANFHSLVSAGENKPIYLRNLSYDTVYLSRNENGSFTPSIIKMECAKIDMEGYKTVIKTVRKSQELEARSITKYRDPEMVRKLDNNSDPDSIDYEAADVYALGVLFGDILSGSVKSEDPVTEKDLLEDCDDDDLKMYAELIKMITEDYLEDKDKKQLTAQEVVDYLTP